MEQDIRPPRRPDTRKNIDQHLPAPVPISRSEALAPRIRKTSRKRAFPKKILLLSIFIAAIAGGSIYDWRANHQTSPIPADISQNVDHPIFYPAKYIMPGSVSETNGIITYKINYQGETMFASVQATPPAFDFNNFARQIISQTALKTPVGNAIEGKLNGKTMGSLNSGGTWLLISAPPTTPDADMQDVLKNLTK